MSASPEKIGKYEVEGLLGKGAMGAVYRCRDPLMGRTVAVKRFLLGEHLDPEQGEEFLARFFQEARIAGALRHPNIVTVHDADLAGGVPFIVMEYMEGGSLASLMRRERAVAPVRALDVIRQAALGLAYAHEQGVVHRDIKPDNLLIDLAGRVAVSDFGAARLRDSDLTRTGEVLGTPHYMSPEQVLGEPLDGRSDLFSLGVLLYLLLTGQRPFKGETVSSICYHIVHSPPEPLPEALAAPGELRALFARLLAKAREERPADGRALAAELDALGAGLAPGGAPAGVTQTLELSTPSPWAQRSPISAGARPAAVTAPPAGEGSAEASYGKAKSRWLLAAAMTAVAAVVLCTAAWIGWKAMAGKRVSQPARPFEGADSTIRETAAPVEPPRAPEGEGAAATPAAPPATPAPSSPPRSVSGEAHVPAKPDEPSRAAEDAAALATAAAANALREAQAGRAADAGQTVARARERLDGLAADSSPADRAAIAAATDSLSKGKEAVDAAVAAWASPILDRAEAALAKATERANTDEDAIITAYADAYPVLRQSGYLPGSLAQRAEAFAAACRDELNDDEWAQAEDLAKTR